MVKPIISFVYTKGYGLQGILDSCQIFKICFSAGDTESLSDFVHIELELWRLDDGI